MTYVERDANLFAVALLIDDETEAQLSGSLVNMENHLLKAILDYNIVYPN